MVSGLGRRWKPTGSVVRCSGGWVPGVFLFGRELSKNGIMGSPLDDSVAQTLHLGAPPVPQRVLRRDPSGRGFGFPYGQSPGVPIPKRSRRAVSNPVEKARRGVSQGLLNHPMRMDERDERGQVFTHPYKSKDPVKPVFFFLFCMTHPQ